MMRPPPPGARALDAVYDHNYTLSSDREQGARAAAAAAGSDARAARGTLMPSAENMFSELQHHPRATLRLGGGKSSAVAGGTTLQAR